jgi:hypothetical protein
MRRISQYICVFLLALSCWHVVPRAHAAYISISDPKFGNNSITVDTDTGLQWLKVSLSANRTYNDVAGQFEVGGDFAGFRYAPSAEVASLFNAFGLVSGLAGNTQAQFMNIFGATTFQESFPEVFGLASISSNGLVPVYGLDFYRDFVNDPLNGEPSYQIILGSTQFNPAYTSPEYGSWLVQPIPLPPAMVFIATGLACLGLMRTMRMG